MARQFDQLRWYGRERPDTLAYTDLISGRSITYGEWDARSDRLAARLQSMGVGVGDRVALHLTGDHVIDWIVAYPAIHKAGAVAVPTNTRLTAPELAGILGHAGPTVVLTSAELRPVVDHATERTDDGWTVLDDADHTWGAADAAPCDPVDAGVGDDDLADIMYTSGTTGLPKGIAVRHRNTHIIPNGEPEWSGNAWIHCSPLFTFAGMSFVYNPMKLGMHAYYLPRFDVDRWLDAVEAHRPTMAFLVPAMVQLLLHSPRFEGADLSSLTMISIGSAPLPPSLHLEMAAKVPHAVVSNSYSMTEAGTTYTFMPPGELERHLGSVGIPMSEVRIVDDDGRDLSPGTVGEILIGVGEQHREYYKDPEATAATWNGAWLRSGDLGELDDDGYLYIRGRKKDVIIRGGNNIVATDVESVLYEHPDVLEAAVVGVPHEVLGEDVAAFVVVKPGRTLDAAALTAFCGERLADYKVPRHVEFRDELPRNPTGKVQKRELVLTTAL